MSPIPPLPIREAVRLNKLLSPYLPEINGDAPLDFVGKIIENIKNNGQHSVYLDAIALMYKTTPDKIVENSTPEEALTMFVEGLIANRITALHQFCQKLGL